MEKKNYRPAHQKTKNKNSLKVILIVVALSVAIVVSAFLLVSWGEKNAAQNENSNVITDDASENEGLRVGKQSSEKGFPVSFSSSGIKDIKAVKNNIIVLTKEMINCVSKNGSHVFSEVLNYAEPVLKVSGKYGIVYDRLSGKYTVFNNRKILFSKSTENESQIITAQISPSGNYAITSRNSDSASLLSYYDKNGKLIYAWACSKEYIVAVDIAENKKNILCAALNAQNGEILTKVYLLDVTKEETQWETELEATAAIDCFFTSPSKAVIVCNDKRVALMLKKDRPPVISSYSSGVMNYSSDSSGNSAIVTSKFGSFDSYEVTFYNSSNAITGSAVVKEKIIDIKCIGQKAYVLTSNSVITVSASGKISTKIELDDVELGLEVSGMNIYHFSLGYLFKN